MSAATRSPRSVWIAIAAVATLFAGGCGHDAARPNTDVNASSPAAAPAAPPQIVIPPSDAAPPAEQTGGFDGAKAYDQVAKLVAFGPHPPATDGIRAVQQYIHSQLQSFGCAVEDDDFNAQTDMGMLAMRNIVAKIPGTGQGIILLLTHYDTKRVDDFVGAEDGGSSTGLMLEMARVLCGRPKQANAVWIAFLDGEETQAQFEWKTADSVYGSRELAARMAISGDLKRVRAAILADMIGQYGLHILRDTTAPKWLNDTIWGTAGRLGYQSVFVSQAYATEDDNLPFIDRHVPVIDLIDLDDYINAGYWHTTKDTLDKISPRSLAVVGHVILESVDQLQKR